MVKGKCRCVQVFHTSPFQLQTSKVVAGGGVKVDEKGNAVSWQSTSENFLFHQGTIVRTYKAKLADELRAAGLYDSVPAEAWNKKFVVDIEPVGHGVPTLKYLAPYVHRVAISDK